jgi:hypothetical protein
MLLLTPGLTTATTYDHKEVNMKTQISKQHTVHSRISTQTTFHKEDRMKKQNFTTLKLAIFFAMAVTMALSAFAQEQSPEELRLQDEWRVSMAKAPLPRKGCFQSEYPSKEWHEIACIAAPNRPLIPKQGPRPLVVGNGNDISAQAPTGHISSAFGSFDSVTGVTSESDSLQGANWYTLQLNTDTFSSSACTGTGDPADCRGWEQFAYANDGTSFGEAFIQYWIIKYDNPCPAGWNTYIFSGSSHIYCWRNDSMGAVLVPNQPITNLGKLGLSGTATGAGDSLKMSVGVMMYGVTGDNSVDAANGWTAAEFNVFGWGDGSQAVFNSGADLVVRERIDYGGTAPPNCLAKGFTGETNNLNFPLSPPAPSSPGPAIIFETNTAGGASANCAAATSVGDTHLYTALGLHYDFQASGDFVVAQADRDFLVEARQVSGAPNWPNAALNHDIAAQMGRDTVAVCGPTQFGGSQLFVDGQPIDLEDGHVYSTPNGVDIWRFGDRYNATDQSGNSVNAVVNTYSPNSWINLTIGLGNWPANLTGLVANANQDVYQIASSGRDVLTAPFAFGEFYHLYGDSWRVGFEGEDLLSVCGEQTEIGDPRIPFYASQLPPQLYEQSRAVCTAAGVIGDALLDACTLDVGVIGNEAAAQVYVNARQPVAVGTIIGPNVFVK